MPKKADLFELVCDMEGPLDLASNMAKATMLIAEHLDNDIEAAALNSLAEIIRAQIQLAEDIRGALFGMTHPNPSRVELVRAKETGQS